MAQPLSQFQDLNCQKENRPKSEAVASALKDFIAKGHYAPGEKLPSERDLALALSVSRVSIRSALQQLKAQGLILTKPGGGTFVSRPVSDAENPLFELVTHCSENLRDLFLVHTHLDAWGVRRAAERITSAQIATLRDLVREYKSNGGNPKKLSSLDSKIHLQIAQSTGSAIYINLSLLTRDVLGQVLKHHRVQIFEDLVHVSQIGRKNWLLVEALSDGNPDKAEEIMRDRRAYFGKALDLDLDMSEQPKAAVPIEQINLYR